MGKTQTELKAETIVGGYYDAGLLSVEVTGIVYNQGKGRLFTFLESQFEGQRLSACKKIVEEILSDVSRNAGNLVRDMLGEWRIEVEACGEVTQEEAEKALDQHSLAEDILLRRI